MPPQIERSLRHDVRGNLSSWSRFALAPTGQTPARHHLAIIDALEGLVHGTTRRLLLLLPPGSAKSTYATKLFPVWWLLHNPGSSVITACHTAGLAGHFGRTVRGLIEEHTSRLNLTVRQDARAAHRFLTKYGGEYYAVGLHGAVTGRRADLAVIDDPIASFAEATKLSSRERAWAWFRSELVTRLKPDGRIVVVMTRWNVDDLAGRLLEQGGWDAVRLPAIAEVDDPLGRLPGQALWPEWEDLPALLGKKQILGERGFTAMFQQTPQPDGGRLFDTRRVIVVDAVPPGTAVRAWDLAATDGDDGAPDWTVGLKLVRHSDGFFTVDDIVRTRVGPGQVADAIKACADNDGRQVLIGLPQDPGQAGRSQVMFLTAVLAGYRVQSRRETGSKILRCGPVSAQVEHGTLRIRRAAWNAAFLDELSSFPHGQKDDQVDALGYAFALLTESKDPARFASLPHSVR